MFNAIKVIFTAAFIALSSATVANAAADFNFGSAARVAAGAQHGINGNGNITPDAASVNGGITPNVSGSKSVSNETAVAAIRDASTVANAVGGRAGDDVTGSQIPSVVASGVYRWTTSLVQRREVTIDGGGRADAQHTFIIDGTAIFANGTRFRFINGASVCSTVFVFRSDVKIESGAAVAGNLLGTIAGKTIVQESASSITGRVFALDGSMVLDGSVDASSCVPAPPVIDPEPPVDPPVVVPVPEPQPEPKQVPKPQPSPETPITTIRKKTPKGSVKVRPQVCRLVGKGRKSSRQGVITLVGKSLKSASFGAKKVNANKKGSSIVWKISARQLPKKAKTVSVKVNFKGDFKAQKLKVKVTSCKQPTFTG